MPRKGSPFEKGRLFVLFSIKFPENYSLGDEQVRLGMQTTYLDERLRITRCTTRALAGACAVPSWADWWSVAGNNVGHWLT